MAPWRLHVGGHVGGAVGVLAELQLPAGGAEGRSVGSDGRPASEDQHRTALSQLWPRAAVASLHPCSPVQLSCSYPATPAGTPRHRREAAVALSHTQYLPVSYTHLTLPTILLV